MIDAKTIHDWLQDYNQNTADRDDFVVSTWKLARFLVEKIDDYDDPDDDPPSTPAA